MCRPHPKRRLLSCLPTIEFSGMRQRKLTGLDWLGSKIPLHYKSIKYIKVDVPIVAVFYRFMTSRKVAQRRMSCKQCDRDT